MAKEEKQKPKENTEETARLRGAKEQSGKLTEKMPEEVGTGSNQTRRSQVNLIDQDSYLLVKGSRRLGHFTPETPDIFAVDIDMVRESSNRESRAKELLRKSVAEGSSEPKSLMKPKPGGSSKPEPLSESFAKG
jgi:hypothetical protein